MMLTESLFIGSVNHGVIQSLIMLPNTNHIKGSKAHISVHNAMNDVLGFHSVKKMATGRLHLSEDRQVSFFANSPFKSDDINGTYFKFQKSKHRYTEVKLRSLMGDDRFHPRQLEYLNSRLITHCWVAIHEGVIVGLIAYPVIQSNKSHDPRFEQYKSLARRALQLVGYVVSCDLVLNPITNALEVYNIHKEYEKKDVVIPYFTRRVPVNKHLKFIEHNN